MQWLGKNLCPRLQSRETHNEHAHVILALSIHTERFMRSGFRYITSLFYLFLCLKPTIFIHTYMSIHHNRGTFRNANVIRFTFFITHHYYTCTFWCLLTDVTKSDTPIGFQMATSSVRSVQIASNSTHTCTRM